VGKIVLKNGLQIFLISDPGIDQSAAGLAVRAGSWQDPAEYPGMAHFLEHMLFNGTAAFPKEFEYMQYVHDNGGQVNAFTAADRTVYMFSVNNGAFEGALERFSHFFIDPLFSPSCIRRELHAVDQEHAKNVENDNWRQYMIFKETGNPAHPIVSFSTGNAKTLSGIPQEALKTWYRNNYSANRMHLAVISPLPLEDMVQLAVQKFSAVPNYQLADQELTEQMSSFKQRGHKIYIKPIKDLKQLSLTWEVPPAFSKDNEKHVLDLVASVVGSGEEKSLQEALKKEGLAEEVRASADRLGKNHTLFSIDVTLTDQGMKQVNTVILRTFQVISKLKAEGIPPHIFDEMCQMAVLNYQYQSRDDAFDTITGYAQGMPDESLATYPEKTVIPTTYDPAFIHTFLNSLTAESCIYFVTADPAKTGIEPDTQETWMGAEFAIRALSQSTLTTWNTAAPSSQMHLPAPNAFIPQNVSLVDNIEKESDKKPTLLVDDAMSQIYFTQDTRYQVPECCLLLSLKSPLFTAQTKSNVLTDLYIKALEEKLSSTLFRAAAAGLSSSFSYDKLKMTVSISGYNDKAPLLAREIFQHLRTVQPTSEQFEIYRTSLASEYDNASKELPLRQARDLLSSIVFKDIPTSADKHSVLSTVTYEEFVQFSQNLFASTFLEGMIYGNLTQEMALQLSCDIKTQLASQAYPPDEQHKRQVLVLPSEQGPFMLLKNTPRNGNGVILMLEEGEFSFEKRGLQQILSIALRDAFFDALRTKQQTGYIAQAWDMEEEGHLFQFFGVQSSTHQTLELLARFNLFLEDFSRNFRDTLPPERFENIRNMLIISLEMPPENMTRMTQRLFKFAFDYGGDFDWIEKRVSSIKTLSYEQLEKNAHDMLSRANARRLAVLMEGVLPQENNFHYEIVNEKEISDLSTFVPKVAR
jgi:insulysin